MGLPWGPALLQSLQTSLWEIMKKTGYITIHPVKFCSIDAMLMTSFVCSITRKTRSCSLIRSTPGTRVFVSQWKGKSIRSLFSCYGKTQCFPSWVIDKIISRYLSKKMNPPLTRQNASSNYGKTSPHFYKLPALCRLTGFLKSPRLS